MSNNNNILERSLGVNYRHLASSDGDYLNIENVIHICIYELYINKVKVKLITRLSRKMCSDNLSLTLYEGPC